MANGGSWWSQEQVIDDYNRYAIGFTSFSTPDEKEVREVFFMVAYDISDPARLRRVAKTCEDYGVRVEKSVFECDLTEALFERFWLELMDLIDEEEDAVLAYRLCRGCVREIESMGQVIRRSTMMMYYA